MGCQGVTGKSVYAVLYIFPENKAKAKSVMEDIINNSGRKLASSQVYKDMFYGNEANEFNSESLI